MLGGVEPNYYELAVRQHSLVTAAQLASLGWTKSAVHHAVNRRLLWQVRRGLYAVGGARPSREQAWLAAVLAAGPSAVLSHGSASELWQLDLMLEPDAIDVLLAGDDRPRLTGVRGHQTAALPPGHRTVRRSIPVTTAERTVIDACGLVTQRVLEVAVEQAMRDKTVQLPRLARAADEVPVSGRRRIAPVVEVLRQWIPGFDAGGSRPELDLVRLLTRAGFPKPDQQIRVRTEGRTFFVDVGWRDRRVGFEYDSVAFHSHGAFHRDRERWRYLKRAGWDIWPVTSRTPANEVLAIAATVFPKAADHH